MTCFVCHTPAQVLTGEIEAPERHPEPRAPLPGVGRARVELWTDGASSKDGTGGWAFILVALTAGGEVVKRIEDSGGAEDTTNNRMEMMAAMRGLLALTRSTAVTVISDSAYLVNAFRENWFERWERDGWTRKVRGQGRQPVANKDLWEELRALDEMHDITWEHVRGHAGHALNEQCDRLAVAAKKAIQESRKVAA